MSVYRERGDAIEGEIITCQARKIDKPELIQGTGAHRLKRVVIRRNAFCVIDKPIRLR